MSFLKNLRGDFQGSEKDLRKKKKKKKNYIKLPTTS